MTYSVFQTLYTCAQTVYLSRAVTSNEDRISLSSFSGMAATMTSIVLSVALPSIINHAGNGQAHWKTIALTICLPSMMLTLIRIFFIPETHNSEIKKIKENLSIKENIKSLFSNNYLMFFTFSLLLTNITVTLVSTSQTYYFKYIIGNIASMTAVSAVSIIAPLSIILFPSLSKKIGMRNLMMIALMPGFIGRILPIFQTTNIALLIIGSLLSAISYMPIYILCSNAIIGCMDYGEYKNGVRSEGIYSCVSGFCSKVGIGLASGILGIVTYLGGYDGTLSIQSSSANISIIISYTLLPAFLIAPLVLHKFDLEKRLPEIQKTLENRKRL